MTPSDSGNSPDVCTGTAHSPFSKEEERERACAIQQAIKGLAASFVPRLSESLRSVHPSDEDTSGVLSQARLGLQIAIVKHAQSSPKSIDGFAHRVANEVCSSVCLPRAGSLDTAILAHFSLGDGDAGAFINELATLVKLADSLSLPYLSAVTKFAAKSYFGRLTAPELRQEVWLALRTAALHFDPDKTAKFFTYAVRVAKNHLLDLARDDRGVSDYAERLISTFEVEKQSLFASLGQRPSDAEVMSYIGWSERTCTTYRRAVQAIRSLRIDENEPLGVASEVGSPRDPVDGSSAKGNVQRLGEAIAELVPEQRHVVVEHHFEKVSLRQIAKDQGVSDQRIRRLHDAALLELRRRVLSAPDSSTLAANDNEGSG
jgi:RNA polymerase sigma factor (sigma-70 family)